MTGKLNVLSICGSLRKGSINRMVERSLPDLAPEGMNIAPAPAHDKFPLYNFDIQQQGMPADVIALCQAIYAADGIVIVTPEYNFSITPSLKNTIDWLSRIKEPSPFARKPFAIQSAANGMLGGARMQYHLRQVLVGLNAYVLPVPEVFIGTARSKVDEATGALTDEPTRDFIRKQLAAFAAFIEQLRPRR